MVCGKWCTPAEFAEERRSLWKEIFQEQIDPCYGDGLMTQYALLYEGDRPVAVGSLGMAGRKGFLDGIGVIQERRGMGYGGLILRMVIQKAFRSGAEELQCNAPTALAPFLQKYAFCAVDESKDALGWQEFVCKEEPLCHCQLQKQGGWK